MRFQLLLWKESIRVLGPDGKLCIDIMPLFESGNATTFKRRITHTVISDIEKFMDHNLLTFHRVDL